MNKHLECSAHIPFCAGMLIAVSVSIFLRLCSVSIGWCLSVGLPLSLFVPSVFVTMPALSLCPEPNGWLVKGTEMWDWAVSDALHLYSAQGAKPEEETCQSAFLTRAPALFSFPLHFFTVVNLPLSRCNYFCITELGLADETDRVCRTYKSGSCLVLVYFWLWNVALGNRELHWGHLVPALFRRLRGGFRVGREMWSTLWEYGLCRAASEAIASSAF